jgi:tRNA threonylcarbamoyladenosine modification (KEOPS) complex  Pcc1 subunit
MVAHVHAAVKHDAAVGDGQEDAGAADVLAGAQWQHLDHDWCGQGAIMMMYQLDITVGFKDDHRSGYAEMIKEALEVDLEPRPDKITRSITVSDGTILMSFRSDDVKLLRTASSGFLENFNLAVEVVDEFSGSK